MQCSSKVCTIINFRVQLVNLQTVYKLCRICVKECKVVNFFTGCYRPLNNSKNCDYLRELSPLKSLLKSYVSRAGRAFRRTWRMRYHILGEFHSSTSRSMSNFLPVLSKNTNKEQSSNVSVKEVTCCVHGRIVAASTIHVSPTVMTFDLYLNCRRGSQVII